MDQQRVLYSGDRRFMVVLEEQALRVPVGSLDVMAGQLDWLLAVMSLQRVSLGIVPARNLRRVFASASFWIYDEAAVGVETPTAKIEVTQPREITQYVKMFRQLQAAAVYGAEARTLVNRAIADLVNPQE